MLNQLKNIQEEKKPLSQEAVEILNLLDAIENHTAELRKKIVEEVSKQAKNNIHLSLNKVEE